MTTVRGETIGYGDYGSAVTLTRMADIINSSLTNPIVVETANGIVSMVPSRDYMAMALAIRAWLAKYFKFVPDPLGVELLRTPEYLLNQYMTRSMMTGDCDDAAILGLALGKAVGIAGKLIAVGFQAGGPLAHVYGVLTGPPGRAILAASKGRRGGVELDVTRPAGTRIKPVRRVERIV